MSPTAPGASVLVGPHLLFLEDGHRLPVGLPLSACASLQKEASQVEVREHHFSAEKALMAPHPTQSQSPSPHHAWSTASVLISHLATLPLAHSPPQWPCCSSTCPSTSPHAHQSLYPLILCLDILPPAISVAHSLSSAALEGVVIGT